MFARGPAERAVQRVAGQLGRMLLCRAEAPELSRDLRGADACGIQQTRTADQLHRGAARGDRRAAAARVEARVENPPVRAGAIDGDRYADQVAAGRTAGRAAAGIDRGVALALRELQVLGEHLDVHVRRV